MEHISKNAIITAVEINLPFSITAYWIIHLIRANITKIKLLDKSFAPSAILEDIIPLTDGI